MSLQGKTHRTLPRISADLRHHLFRGLFDADGSVVPKNKTFSMTFSHCSEDIIQSFGNELRSLGICKGKPFRKSEVTWQISACGRGAAQRWANWMYPRATRFLMRKASRFKLAWSVPVKHKLVDHPYLLPKTIL